MGRHPFHADPRLVKMNEYESCTTYYTTTDYIIFAWIWLCLLSMHAFFMNGTYIFIYICFHTGMNLSRKEELFSKLQICVFLFCIYLFFKKNSFTLFS